MECRVKQRLPLVVIVILNALKDPCICRCLFFLSITALDFASATH